MHTEPDEPIEIEGTRPATGSGFSVVEIIATLAVVALLSTAAVPNFLSHRTSANETQVVATLRRIAAAQRAFREQACVDRDGDGIGEHGTLAELAGVRPGPGAVETVAPPLLPRALGGTDADGRATAHGYWFALHLPDAAGRGVASTSALRTTVDGDLAERHWTCVAWPARQGETGLHTYFVNERGAIRKNRTQRYSGTDRVPPAGAALVGAPSPHHVVADQLATDEAGADGAVWLEVP